PDINKSRTIFWVEGNGIRFGLGGLRGVGQEAIEKVIQERTTNGLFKDFEDFITRCSKYVNKRIVESLIYSGAFDCFGYHRAQYAAVYEEAMARINVLDKQKASAQISIFGFGGLVEEQKLNIKFPDLPEYEMMEKLAKEKSVLGVYVSGHPFEKVLPYFKDETFNCSKLGEYEEEEDGTRVYTGISDGQAVSMGGMVADFKKLQTRGGAFMAFVTVEDMYGSIECVCFPKVYDKIRGFLEKDKVVSLKGKISISADKAPAIIVERMDEFNVEERTTDEKAEEKQTQTVKAKRKERLWLNVTGMAEEDKDELLETLTFYEGDTEVVFVENGRKMSCSQKVNPSRALMAELASFLEEKCIKLA
ncbi:MAG: hypothetical protein IKC37_01855, partial [Clostridia bacterium]|nr:hypothetical protein [Clostridia bacterium]